MSVLSWVSGPVSAVHAWSPSPKFSTAMQLSREAASVGMYVLASGTFEVVMYMRPEFASTAIQSGTGSTDCR